MRETIVRDLTTDKIAQRRAKELGIHRVPAVVVNGNVAELACVQPIDALAIRLLVGDSVQEIRRLEDSSL